MKTDDGDKPRRSPCAGNLMTTTMMHPTSNRTAEDIAIVGMACLLPRADTPAQFWQNIVGKVDCLSDPLPESPHDRYSRPGTGLSEPIYTGRGGYLGDISRFNPMKYGVMPAGIDGAEPDQFLALRCAHETLADAGVPDLPLNREKTGIILGRGVYSNRGVVSVFLHGYAIDQFLDVLHKLEPHRDEKDLELIRRELKKNLPPFTTETVPGLVHCSMTGRIANRFDLKGPAYTLDAACASSLVAVEHGIRELRMGHCDAVLAGGVTGSITLFVHQLFCRIDALSKSGRIAPFSKHAQGTMLGEGCAMLLLKRRGDAERDGNRIYALVKEVGVSSDGRGAGLLAPRTEGQQLAIQRAYAQAGIDPATVELVEAHGTGIPVGDKTEVTSLRACFGRPEDGLPTVALGSVKSNIGHSIPAAGAVSIIKSALALYHRTLPPTLNAEEPDPELGLQGSRFYLSTQPRPWVHGDEAAPRRAAINAFGFGGINAHTILEEYPADEATLDRLESDWPMELVVISAANRQALRERVTGLAQWLGRAQGVRLLDIAASCADQTGPCKLALIAPNVEELTKRLLHVGKLLGEEGRERIQDRSGIFWYAEPLASTGRVAFVFPGAGAQYPHMLTELCRHFPEVRRQFDLCDAGYRRFGAKKTLSRLVFPLPGEEAHAEAELFVPPGRMISVMTAERGLLALLSTMGIKPDCIVGHSSGEFIAFQAAGAFASPTEEELIQSIVHGLENDTRQATPGLIPDVVLTAVGGVNPAVIEEVLAASGGKLEVAIDNCPHQVVLAGDEATTATALEQLKGKGGLCERVPVKGLHTSAFAAASRITAEFFERVQLRSPKVELWSCTYADRYPTEPAALMELASRQLRSRLRFRETVEAMHADGVRVFIEVGPRNSLSGFIADTLGKRPHLAVPLDVPRRPGLEQLCRALAMLAAHGVPMDLRALYRRRRPSLLDFRANPPAPPKPEPYLNKAIPELQLGADAVQHWRDSAPAIAETADGKTPATVPSTHEPPLRPGSETPATTPSLPDPRTRALADYQQTMRQFLQTQQQVAMARFSRGTAPRPATPSPAPARIPTIAEAAVPIAKNGDSYPAKPHRPVAEPAAQTKAVAVVAAPAAQVKAASVSLEDRLLEIVSERTGYPVEMLSFESNLEADLGIDSIKRVEVIAAFRRAVVPEVQEPPPEFMERMAGARTLQAILEGVSDLTRPAPMDRVPIREGEAPAELGAQARREPRPPKLPYLESILTHEPNHRLLAECELDVARHRWLRDHTFFGRELSATDREHLALPVMPLAMMLELMAEAAAALQPGVYLAALRDVRMHRWLAFETTTRRVRIEATVTEPGEVRVSVVEADREGMSALLAECVVETTTAPPTLGKPTLPDAATTPYPWGPDALYGRTHEDVYGQVVFHGPAFRGIVRMEALDAHAGRATVREPEAKNLLPAGSAGDLVLPAGLIDQCGQIAVFGLVRERWTREEVLLAFPTRLARVEFRADRDRSAQLRAVARMSEKGTQLFSDVEFLDRAGNVVLRVLGREEEIARLPADLYAYWTSPRRVHLNRDITGLFQGVPGIEHCAVCAIGNVGNKILVNRLWVQAVARMILGAGELKTFGNLKLPPVPTASWLLGRAAAKDAVRLRDRLDLCMADVAVHTEDSGRPTVRVPGGSAPLVSIAHKGFGSVAVAATAERFHGVGIDLEPLGTMDAGVRADAFSPEEATRIERAAQAAGELADSWYLSAWSAKEAVGKALGTGVLGGPRSLEVREVDAAAGRIVLALRGPMAEKHPAFAAAPVTAVRRVYGEYVVALCLLARP